MIELIKYKMCEFANIDYNTVNWHDGTHLQLTWTKEQEDNFRKWMVNELRTSSLFRKSVSKFPNLVKTKIQAEKLTNEFIFNYGFKTSGD